MAFIKSSHRMLWFSALLFCFGCKETLSKKEYYQYFSKYEKSSYLEVENNGYVYQLQFRPPEFMALNDLKSGKDFSKNTIQQKIEEYTSGNSFCLRIQETEPSDVLRSRVDQNGYYQRIAALNSDFPYLIKGVSDQSDSLSCQFHLFERNYKVTPFVQVLFSLPNESGALEEVLFKDIIFNNGEEIRFSSFSNYKNSLPQLQL
jgi:hypothetical protein